MNANEIEIFERHAFENTDLQSIVIPEGVREIKDYCFHNCLQLNNIILPSSLNWINSYAFANTSIVRIMIPPFAILCDSCFANCNQLVNIQLPIKRFGGIFNTITKENANDEDEGETISKELTDKTVEIELTDNNVQAPAINDERLANPIFLDAVNRKLDRWFGPTKNPNLQRKNIKSIKILN